MAGHKPTIYLRNTFRLKWDEQNNYLEAFLHGKKKFLETTKPEGQWTLVAAFAEWPLLENQHVVEPDFEIIQIWRLEDWPTLYNTMVDLSETSWYRQLGATLRSENQELLINAGVHEALPDIHWDGERPHHMYVYETSRPKEGRNQAYLREVNWLSAKMSAAYDWKLVWWASQITAQPAKLSILWRVEAGDGPSIVQQLVDIAQTDRYNRRTIGFLETVKRRIYHPIYTERLAQLTPGQNTRHA
jgi:hypothetical protein